MKLFFNQSTCKLSDRIKQPFSKLINPQNPINRNRNGFSLMSLVIVIAVIAVLVIMAVPAFIGYIEDARISRLITDARIIQDASDRYYMANGVVFWDPHELGVEADDFIVELDNEGNIVGGNGSMEHMPESFISGYGTVVSLTEILEGLGEEETARFFNVELPAIKGYATIRSDPAYFIVQNPTGLVLVANPMDAKVQERTSWFNSEERFFSEIEYSIVPESLEIEVSEGGTADIEVTVTDPAEGYTVEFESASTSVATVDGAGSVGTVTGIKEGETEVEVTITADGYYDVTETITVSVIFEGMELVNFYYKDSTVLALTFGSDGYLYSGGTNGEVHKIHPSSMIQVAAYTGHSDYVNALTFGSDGYLYSGSADNQVHKIHPLDMNGGIEKAVGTYTGHGSNNASRSVLALTFGSDGYLYSGNNSGSGESRGIHKIDPSDMSKEATYTGHGSNGDLIKSVHALTFGSDGYLYSGGWDSEVHKINPSDMNGGIEKATATYTGHIGIVYALTFGDDGYLYSGNSRGTGAGKGIHKVDPSDMDGGIEKAIATYTWHNGSVRDLTFGSDGYLYSGSADNQVHKLDPSDMSQVATYTEHNYDIYSLTFGSDGYLYSGSMDKYVHRIRVE